MFSPQAFVIGWLEYFAAAAILLAATKLVVARLRQPIDRINLIAMSLLATAVVPLLLNIASVPGWHVGLFPADIERLANPSQAAEPDTAAPLPLVPTTDTAAHRQASRDNATVPSAPNLNRPSNDNIAAAAAPISDGARLVALAERAPSPQRSKPWLMAAVLLWLLHAAAFFWFAAEWMVGSARLRKLTQRAEHPEQAVLNIWHALCEGRANGVRLLVTAEISGPMVFGWRRPVVLLPQSIATGDPCQLRSCLAHECSHVLGGDLGTWRRTNLCRFLLWHQPLFWVLRRELRICQDLVADDRAAGMSEDRIAYSELLLSLAKRPISSPAGGAIAFYDRSSQLSRRIRMLLQSSGSLRSRSPRPFLWISALLLLTAAMLFGSVRLNTVRAEEAAQDASATAGNTSEQATPNKVVRGRVIDELGQPVAGAQLWLPLQYRPRRCVQTTSDESGNFELECPAEWINPQTTGSMWTAWAYAPGYSIQSQSVYDTLRGDADEEYTIRLPAESTTRFKVLTPAGEPLANALVQPQNYQTTVGYDAVPDEMLSVVSARTNRDGFATLPAIQSGPLFRVQVKSDQFGRQTIRADWNADVPDREIRLRQTASIQGRLVGDNPAWLRDVRITLETDNRDAGSDPQGVAEVVTDATGHFNVPAIASGGPLRIYVEVAPELPVRPQLVDGLYLTAGETVQLEIPLVKAPLVRGKVIAKPNGQPVVGAEISLGYGVYRQSTVAVTDEQGQYQGRVLPGSVRAHIVVLPGEYMQLGEPWAEPYKVPKGVEEFELPTIEVVGTQQVSGQLLDAQDNPLPDRRVMAVVGNRIYGRGTSNTEGRFTMKVPDGVETQIKVSVKNRGLDPTTTVQQDPLVVRYTVDVREQEMEALRALKPDVVLTGRVLRDGKPIADIPIVLNRGIPLFGTNGTRIEQVNETTTDTDGHYRLTGLKAGDAYSIEIKPPFPAADPTWHHQSPYMPKLAEDADNEVVLPDVKLMELSQSLEGVVVDLAGQPVEGATVSVRLRSGRPLARLTSTGPPPWTQTDAQGRFQLKQLPDKPLSIMAYIANPQGGPIRSQASLDAERNQQDIQIVLDTSQPDKEEP